jgi:hypothetical protein
MLQTGGILQWFLLVYVTSGIEIFSFLNFWPISAIS